MQINQKLRHIYQQVTYFSMLDQHLRIQQQQQQQQLSLLSQASRGRLDMKPKGTINIKTRRRRS
jgi:hypothetical protein